jgi:sugar phosphate isomerase/epimerase
MKFGVADYGMNVWSGGLFDVENRLVELKKAGFDGIERLEAATEAQALYNAMTARKLRMDFLTCQAPATTLSLQWSAALQFNYVWLDVNDHSRNLPIEVFCRRANEFVAAAARYGIRAGLHNHLGSRIENQQELLYFMQACPDAMLLLDIGHLHAAGGDCVEVIEKYAERLCAVHFKDVEILNESLGLDRWYERLRFCGLGEGNCALDYAAVARELTRKNYQNWFLVEHDTHTDEPVKQLKQSLDILKNILA